MAIRKLHRYPFSGMLTTPAKEVSEITDNIKHLIDDMFETMNDNDGVGLAAPQIGVGLRIAVLDVRKTIEKNPTPDFVQTGKFELINPEIVKREEEIEWEEGCLSVPEFWVVMKRSKKITLRYLDRKGKENILRAEGILAIAIQQEIDHLNGVLIIDSVSRLKRDMYLRKVKKEMRSKERNE